MRADLKRAVELVRLGRTYGEAAKEVGGITRSAVAGACDRAGLKTGRNDHRDGSRAALAAALYAEGLSEREIAARMGLGARSRPGMYLARAGVKRDRCPQRGKAPSS